MTLFISSLTSGRLFWMDITPFHSKISIYFTSYGLFWYTYTLNSIKVYFYFGSFFVLVFITTFDSRTISLKCFLTEKLRVYGNWLYWRSLIGRRDVHQFELYLFILKMESLVYLILLEGHLFFFRTSVLRMSLLLTSVLH